MHISEEAEKQIEADEQIEEIPIPTTEIMNLVLKYIEHTKGAGDFESDEEFLKVGHDVFKAVVEKMFELGLDSDDSKIAYLVMKAHIQKEKDEFEKQFKGEKEEEVSVYSEPSSS